MTDYTDVVVCGRKSDFWKHQVEVVLHREVFRVFVEIVVDAFYWEKDFIKNVYYPKSGCNM